MHNNKKYVTIDEQKTIMIDILKAIDSFCSGAGINYYLAYGTLLGAVRHKGFIPWDDDIDIIMNRRDYEVFINEFNKNRTDSLKLITIDNTPGYYLITAKVCDMRTVLVEDIKSSIEIGVYVDIFVNDYLSNSKREALRIVKRIKRLYLFIMASTIAEREGRPLYKRIILKCIQSVTNTKNREKILRLIEKEARKYENIENSKYCGSVTSLYYGEKEVMESDWWKDSEKQLFEGCYFNAPSKYDQILKHLYGDYMQLPPVEQQKTHHSHVVYWK